MVDSAVTLSIGTELDLSGLQRDLAALKSQKFNFDFDADKIGRSFREANRQMQLKPRVDLSELHELNRLLDVKLNHVKKVQKYFNANPLKIKVNGSSLEITKALNSLKGGDFSVKTKADNQSVGFLRNISQNIKDVSRNTKQRGSFLGTIRTGFLEGIGANSAKRFSEGLTGTLEKQFNSSLNRIGEAVGQGIASTVKSSGRAVTKGVLGVDPKEFTDSIKGFFEEINDFINLDEVKKTTDDLENAFADLLGTIASVDKNLDKIPQDIKNIALSFSKLREPYLEAFSERRKSKISKAAEATIEATTAESVDLDPTKEKLVIVSGGFAGKEGKTGQGLTEIIKKLTGDAAQFEAIADEFTDTLTDVNQGLVRWSAQAAQKIVEMTVTKGYNPDAIVMAAKAVSAREQDPNIPIELVGYSAGGYVVQQAMQILKELGIEGVRGTALGTPIELAQGQGGLTTEEFQAFLGLEDGLQSFVKAANFVGMASEDKSTVAETVSGHNIEAYLADPRVQARLAGSTPMSLKDRTAFDIVRLKKDASAIVSDALEGMQSLSESMGSPIMIESFNAYLTSLISGTQKVSESLQNISEKTPIEEVRQEAEDIRDALLLLQNLMVEIVRLDIPKAEISRDAEDLEGTIEDLLAFAEIQKEIKSRTRPQGKYSIPQQKKEKLPLEIDLPVAITNPASLDLSPVASLLEAAQEAEIGLSRFGESLRNVGSIDVSSFIEATTKLENSMISGSDVIATSFSELSQKIESVEVSPIASSVSEFSNFIDEASNAVLKLKAVIENSLVPSIEQIGKANILAQVEEPSISESQQEKALPVVPALTEIAKVAQEASQSLDKVGTELDAAFKALGDINESTLETFSTTMEEFKAFLMDAKNIVLSAKKKGQPDLRGAATTLGVPTRNPATKKPFTKEELTDYLLDTFDINTVKDAIAKVGAGLPPINEYINKELARQYEAIDKAIKEIDKTPIEQQLRLWDELEAKLLKINEEMNRLQREYSFPGDINQAFQGRKQAFRQQYFAVKTGQELAKGTQIGKDIAMGGAAGIEQNKGQPIAAIQEMAMEMIEVAKDEFGIQSPSKVFKAIGRDILRGLEIGGDLSSYVDYVDQTLKQVDDFLSAKRGIATENIALSPDGGDSAGLQKQLDLLDEWQETLNEIATAYLLLKKTMGSLPEESALKLLPNLVSQIQDLEAVMASYAMPSGVLSSPSTALIPAKQRMGQKGKIDVSEAFVAAKKAVEDDDIIFDIPEINLSGIESTYEEIKEVVASIEKTATKAIEEVALPRIDIKPEIEKQKAIEKINADIAQVFDETFAATIQEETPVSLALTPVIDTTSSQEKIKQAFADTADKTDISIPAPLPQLEQEGSSYKEILDKESVALSRFVEGINSRPIDWDKVFQPSQSKALITEVFGLTGTEIDINKVFEPKTKRESPVPYDFSKELKNNYQKTQVFVIAQLTALREKSIAIDAEIGKALKESDWLKASDLIAAQKQVEQSISEIESEFNDLGNAINAALDQVNTEETFDLWTKKFTEFSEYVKGNEVSDVFLKLRKQYEDLDQQIREALRAGDWLDASDLISAQKQIEQMIEKTNEQAKVEVRIELPDLDLKEYTDELLAELGAGLARQKPKRAGRIPSPTALATRMGEMQPFNLDAVFESGKKSTALVPVMESRLAVTEFNLDAVFESVEEAQQQLSETEFEIGGLDLSSWIDSIAEVITGIKGITSKSWKEIGSEFAKNFKTEGIKKAFGELQETVKSSFSRVFAEAFGDQGAPSRFVQGLIGNLTIGLTQLTNILATRLDSILTAVNETLNGALEGINNFSENLAQNLGKIALIAVQAFALVGIVRGMTALGQAAFQTALEVEQLTRSLSFSSAEGGVTTLDMIKQKAEELSLSFIEAAQGYSQLAASTLGTSLESQTEDIFTGVSTAIAARGLGKEQQSRAFLAISQIASKGRVSLEELNGQLGEALPGALQTAARALGVTSAELLKLVSTGQVMSDEFLPKFADQLALEAGSSVAAAANTATAQLVKFENRLTNIRAELGKGILTPLAAVLPIVNGALKVLSENMTLILGVVTSISAVMAFNLAKALILVAAQFKIVNLALATFGITLEQQVNAVTGKTTVKVIGLQGAIAGLGNAFKMMALQAAPLLILATVVSRIQAATKPLNEDIAKTNKEFVTAINNAKRLRAERERKSEQDGQQTPTGDYQLFNELYGGKNQQRMLGIGVAVNKFLPFMQFGRNKEITQVAETFLDIQRQARLAREDIDLAIEGYGGLTEAQKQQLQENEKATRLKGTELQVASATGLDTTQLKADLEGLRQKREEILNTIQGYDQLVAASNRVDSAIENLNTRLENEQIDRQTYNEELARLTEQKQRVTVLLDDYAEGTKQITNNVRALASELQKVSVEFQNAQLNAERTASMAQMELIKGRLSGKVSAPEFARQQTAIASQQTTATKDAAIAARDAALKSIQSIDNTMLGLELETAFGDQLKTVLSNGTVEAVEAARERLSQGGKELDPAIETALNSIQEYIGLRNQAFELEKQTLEQQLDNRQQAADILQQEIDLLNERAQFEIDTKSLQAEIEQMRQMGAGMLSDFQAQQLSATQEAIAKRRDAARLRTSASEAQLAAQNPDILPEARQRFLRDAQRQNLEAQLKEQEALYAESQARIASELRPLDLTKEQIDINLSAAQQQASVQMNRAMASSALSSFQKEMMQGGSAINQLLFEAQNESFLAQMERGKAGVKGLSPDKRKELLISAQQRENLAEQKRSEAELQQVELQRNKQIRDFEMATKQAAIANDQFYQSRKNAILSEQANAKTVGDIATANIIAQKKQLDLEIEYTKRKLVLNQQQLTSNENLYRRGIIDIDTYNENYSQLTTERLNLQESVTSQQIQLNQQEIDNFQKLADQLKSVNSIREAVLEAQIKGQERATLATNVYSDALSKQGDLIQAQSKIRANGANKAILDAELAVSALNKQTEAEIAILNQKKESATEAEKARIDAEIAKKEADTKAKVEQKSLEIAQEKARLLEQEQATQRKLLALEIERNKITAQQQIKEAEIGALRARNAVVAAQIAVKEKAATGDPVELLQAQLGLQLATEEFRVALGQIDINKQNAVITNQLAALQREGLLGEQNIERARQAGDFALQFGSASNPFNFGDNGFGFSLDPSVKALANMGSSLATVTDFSKYDELLSQLNRAAQPLEAQLETQTNAIKATNDLTGAITSLNEKITGLVTTLGRPNISVSGGSSISDAVELMRMTK